MLAIIVGSPGIMIKVSPEAQPLNRGDMSINFILHMFLPEIITDWLIKHSGNIFFTDSMNNSSIIIL